MRPSGAEDPLGAVFELSDRTVEMAPTARRRLRRASGVVVVGLLLLVALTVLLLLPVRSGPALALVAVATIALGVVALGLLRETDRDLRALVHRQQGVLLFRDADPAPKVPEGRTPVERLTRYLRETNARIDALLREDPGAAKLRVDLPGGERPAPFDLLLVRPGGAFFRSLGLGEAGFAVLARVAPEAVTVADLERFAEDVANVAPHLEALPVRAILVRSGPGPLPDAVYDYALDHPIPVTHGFTRARSSLEILSENADGTYEAVPYVLGVP